MVVIVDIQALLMQSSAQTNSITTEMCVVSSEKVFLLKLEIRNSLIRALAKNLATKINIFGAETALRTTKSSWKLGELRCVRLLCLAQLQQNLYCLRSANFPAILALT